MADLVISAEAVGKLVCPFIPPVFSVYSINNTNRYINISSLLVAVKQTTDRDMNPQRGVPLFLQQYKALFKKNLLLSWRQRRSTFMQLFSSIFFIFLIFCIEKAINARFSTSTAYENVFDPQPLLSLPIPPCEQKVFTKLPCFDFVWSGNGSSKVESIVNNIMANNPGRPIPKKKVCILKFEKSGF